MPTNKLVSGTTGNISALINAALADDWLPAGTPLLASDGTFHQLMYKGLPAGSDSAAPQILFGASAIHVVDALPETPDADVVYLIKPAA